MGLVSGGAGVCGVMVTVLQPGTASGTLAGMLLPNGTALCHGTPRIVP
jgi:hypothetical protein